MADEINRIQLTGKFLLEEDVNTAATILPGSLLKKDSAGLVLKHATASGFHERWYAVEDPLEGKTVLDAYAASTRVTSHLVTPGGKIQAILAAGTNYVVGDELASAGDGTLKKTGSEATGETLEQVAGFVQTALDLSATGAVATLGIIRVA